MHTSKELDFETTIQMFLGNKADNIACQVHSMKQRRAWLTKSLRIVLKRIHKLDTTTRHKELLVVFAEAALQAVKSMKMSEEECSVVLLRLIGSLLGLTRGEFLYTPIYCQNPNQHYAEEIYELGGKVMQPYYDEKNAILVQKRLIAQLKTEGFSDFKISLILGMSEYQVKKLRKEL